VDGLESYFADHLDDGPAGVPAAVTRLPGERTRYVLFKVGQLRFALAATAVAAITREPEAGCDYVSASALVPRRYAALAKVGADHDSYIHLTGTRLGIGPLKGDGETVLGPEDVAPRPVADDEPWIVATLAAPPSLVLERQPLSARLLALSVA